MKKRILTLAAFAAFLGLAATPAPVSAKASTTKTVTRKIKVYRPGHYTTVKQVAVLKKRGKKWSKATWKAYKAPTQSGYKASTSTVKAAKVTSKTKNKTVKITYKAVKRTKKTAVKATSTDSQLQLRQAALSVVNSFRAKAGVKAVRLNSKYNAVLDKRATAKAKQYVTTRTYDHSGYESLPTYLNTYPIVNGKVYYHGGETLHACYYNANTGNATSAMASAITSTFTENMQDEKNDYQAIVVKKTRKNITNISGTYEHYTMMVDGGNHQAYIGVGHYGTGANAMVCIVIEFHN